MLKEFSIGLLMVVAVSFTGMAILEQDTPAYTDTPQLRGEMDITGTQKVVTHDACGTTMLLQFRADNGVVETQIYDVENNRVHRDINPVPIGDGWTELRQQDYFGQWRVEFRIVGDSIEWRVVDSPFSDDRLDFNTTST